MPLGHHVHGEPRRMSLTRKSADESRPDSASGDDETIVEPEQGNVLSHIIAQLRPGADLNKVTLPTFILEPRSMLERITNFMAHPETLLPMTEVEDPVERFLSVVKFYLSGWHIKPPGVKKPLNPILGETFTCYWTYPDQTKGYYISEQTSHHPPKSSYFFMAPEHNIRIDGALKPHSKFLGNSAASMMEGVGVLRFMDRGKSKGGEKYFCTQPNMYARGILWGKMKYELGDHSFVKCPENGLSADIEFKVKGYFGGGYDYIGGHIKDDKTGEILYELSGKWNGEMVAKHAVTGQKQVLFDAASAKPALPLVRPLEEQEERESQKLWHKTFEAIKESNHTAATEEKSRIEDRQRQETAKRQEQGISWQPKYFRKVQGGPGGLEEGEEDLEWILDARIDGATPEEKVKQILAVAPILQGQKPNPPAPKTDDAASNKAPASSSALDDLIDFGPSEPKAPASASLLDASAPASNTNHITTQQKHAPLGLQQPLIPSQPLKRIDTEEGSMDEFVDATD